MKYQSDRRNELKAKTAIRKAAYVMLMQEGLAATSFTAIARESGETRSLVHYYYPKKDQLIIGFLSDALDIIAERGASFIVEGDSKGNLVRNGQLYFAFLLKDEGMRRFTSEMLANRNITQALIQINANWSFPQIEIPEEMRKRAIAAHVVANGGTFELLHERLETDEERYDPMEFAATCFATFLSIYENLPWEESFDMLKAKAIDESTAASIAKAVEERLLS